ncbi:MAG: GNAT family N-acetyltransferase, partial [Ktedonobacteraceae bacterium]|nr:GNAT family N-acetyltransferase [Ktedonobacteraceae bacterium]
PLSVEPIPSHKTLFLLPMLLDADEDVERIQEVLIDPACTAYACRLDGRLIGAAVVRWEENASSEILYIAVAAALRGCGYGKQIIQALQDELLKRGGRSLLVGTANASLENIAFYQKCGFRMYEIRRDYFAYIQPPLSEHGIVLRDMLVLRYDLEFSDPV